MTEDYSSHGILKSVFLHLVPGLIILVVCILFVPIVFYWGFSNDVTILLSDLVGLVPVQLAIILFAAKQQTGKFNFRSQILYLESSKLKEYLIFIPIMAGWALLISAILNPIEIQIRDSLFNFVPTQYILERYDIAIFSKEKLLITGILSIVINGFIAPIMEEIYFRGYLLPRINLSPIKAATLSAVLFSIYHFYSPWYFLSRVLMMIPLYYWVVKKKNIRFSIIAHIISNVVTSVSFLISVI